MLLLVITNMSLRVHAAIILTAFTAAPLFAEVGKLSSEDVLSPSAALEEQSEAVPLSPEQRNVDALITSCFELVAQGHVARAQKTLSDMPQHVRGDFRAGWCQALIEAQKGEYEVSLRRFHDLRVSAKNSPEFLSDFALVKMRQAMRTSQSKEEYAAKTGEVRALLVEAIALNSRFENAFSSLAILEHSLGNHARAWEHVFRAEELGGASIDPKLIDSLSKALPRP